MSMDISRHLLYAKYNKYKNMLFHMFAILLTPRGAGTVTCSYFHNAVHVPANRQLIDTSK